MSRSPKRKRIRSRSWTASDCDRLIALLTAGEPVEYVAATLNRSLNAIKVQATKLRVSATGNLRHRSLRNEELWGHRSHLGPELIEAKASLSDKAGSKV